MISIGNFWIDKKCITIEFYGKVAINKLKFHALLIEIVEINLKIFNSGYNLGIFLGAYIPMKLSLIN